MNPISSVAVQAADRFVSHRGTSPSRLDAAVDAVLRKADSLPDRVTTKAWAAAKLAATVPTLPVIATAMFGSLPLDTAICRRRAQRLPGALGSADPAIVGKHLRLDPGGKYLISSDLHRCIAGARDWPRLQQTDGLYQVTLEHYSQHDWGLVEAGDVEDMWMVGGSAVGAAIDALRLLGGLLWSVDRRLSHATARAQVTLIAANHADTYATIAERFAAVGRYWRLSGNHDDSLTRPEVAAALKRIIPGFAVHDLISLGELDQTPEAVITHGHLTDPWNGPRGAWRGRIITSLANTIADLRGREMGITGATAREALVSGRAGNRLRSIRGPFSMDRDQFTLNETELHEAFADHFGEGAGPWLVMGHTHVPGDGPWDPGTESRYRRYVNSGSGVAERILTAVEWDGTSPSRRPVLVAIALESDLTVPPTEVAFTDPSHRIALQGGAREPIGTLGGERVIKVELSAPTG